MGREHKAELNILTGRWKFPFKDMGVGDWFVVSNITPERAASIGACAVCHTRRSGLFFRRKKIGEGKYIFKRTA